MENKNNALLKEILLKEKEAAILVENLEQEVEDLKKIIIEKEKILAELKKEKN